MSSSIFFLNPEITDHTVECYDGSQCFGIILVKRGSVSSQMDVCLLTKDTFITDCSSLPPQCHQWCYLALTLPLTLPLSSSQSSTCHRDWFLNPY